jgi:hypothetical protein
MRSDSSALKVLVVSAFAASGLLGMTSSAAAQAYTLPPAPAVPERGENAAPTTHEYEVVEISPTRIYGGVWLGFGGHSERDGQNYAANGASTVGGQFGLDVVGFHDILSLGAEARIGSAKSQAGERLNLIDLVLKPRLRFHPEGVPLELYFTVPVGLTVPRLSDSSGEGNVGWNLGIGGGLNVFFSESIGFNIEPMWLTHRFKVASSQGGGDLVLQEFALFLNGVIAL